MLSKGTRRHLLPYRLKATVLDYWTCRLYNSPETDALCISNVCHYLQISNRFIYSGGQEKCVQIHNVHVSLLEFHKRGRFLSAALFLVHVFKQQSLYRFAYACRQEILSTCGASRRPSLLCLWMSTPPWWLSVTASITAMICRCALYNSR